MPDPVEVHGKSPRVPWNKGKLIGAKPPLSPKHVWSIRTRLQLEDRTRDLAMFNLAIDSKLRGCDVVAIKVEAPHGYAADRATVRQRKTGRPVRFELTDQTRQAIDDYIAPPADRDQCSRPIHRLNARIDASSCIAPDRAGRRTDTRPTSCWRRGCNHRSTAGSGRSARSGQDDRSSSAARWRGRQRSRAARRPRP